MDFLGVFLKRISLFGAMLVAGCAAGFNYNECNTNEECLKLAVDGGAKLSCTADHLCVAGTPDDQLCGDTIGTEMPGSLIIGVVFDRTSESDKMLANAVKLAIDEINKRQMTPMVAWFCDSASDPDQSRKAAVRAVNVYHASAIIGPMGSDGVLKLTEFAKSSGTLVVSPSATSTEISSLDDNGLVWRTAASDALQGKLLAAKVKEAMPTPTVVDTMYVNTVYGSGLNTAFRTAYTQMMGLGFKSAVQYSNTKEIPTALNAIAKDAPSHVVIIADFDDPGIVSQIKDQPALFDPNEMDLKKGTQFFMTDPAKTPALYGAMGTMAPNLLGRIRGTAPATPSGQAFTTFQANFNARFGADPKNISFVANAYDATYLIAIAAAATQGRVPTGKDLSTGLQRLRTSGTAVLVGETSYLDAAKQMAMGGVRLEGASGPLEFNAAGDLTNEKAFEYWCVDTTKTPPKFGNLDMMGMCVSM
ncbi:MAG: hypothetical protein EXR72_21930 [Myxococcales bacterium]|nr:hypothetical protein [Myxococcales bacterium]